MNPGRWALQLLPLPPLAGSIPALFFPLGKVPVRGRGQGVLRLPHEAPGARQRRWHRPLRRGDRLHGAQPALPGIHQHSLQRGEGAGLAAGLLQLQVQSQSAESLRSLREKEIDR